MSSFFATLLNAVERFSRKYVLTGNIIIMFTYSTDSESELKLIICLLFIIGAFFGEIVLREFRKHVQENLRRETFEDIFEF